MAGRQAFGVGVLTGLVAAVAWMAGGEWHQAARASQTVDAGQEIIVATAGVGAGNDALCIVDAEKKRVAVYQLKGGNELILKAVRQITWDLEMVDYINNGSRSPSVEEVREGAEKVRKGGGKDPVPPQDPSDKKQQPK